MPVLSTMAVPDTTTVLLGGAVAGLSLLWWLSTRRPSGLPPGPGPALPLLGHVHMMGKDPRAKFEAWRRQYGDVFSLYMGNQLVVVLNGFPVIKEALVKLGDVFSERPHLYALDKFTQHRGIVFSDGQLWKEQRKTSLEILRELGMGKNVLATKVQEEVTHYIRALEEHQGAPVDLHWLTNCSVSNNICSIVFGQRFQYDDPVFLNFLALVEDNVRRIGSTAALNIFPFLDYLPGDLFHIKQVMKNVECITNTLIKPQIQRHKETYQQGHTADFIHAYLREMNALQGQETTLVDINMEATVIQLFIAGTETSATAIRWALLFFLHNPHVQDKCFKELSDVIGTRQPNMGDKSKMTYLEATIMEVLRKADIAPLDGPHRTAQDAALQGYLIPKDTMIIPNLDSVLQDPNIWGDPENFRPERFIGPDGKLTKPEEFIAFGIGRRMCLGESLARMELFLYLSSLIQRFRFLPEDPDNLPPLEGILGSTYCPQRFMIRVVPRE